MWCNLVFQTFGRLSATARSPYFPRQKTEVETLDPDMESCAGLETSSYAEPLNIAAPSVRDSDQSSMMPTSYPFEIDERRYSSASLSSSSLSDYWQNEGARYFLFPSRRDRNTLSALTALFQNLWWRSSLWWIGIILLHPMDFVTHWRVIVPMLRFQATVHNHRLLRIHMIFSLLRFRLAFYPQPQRLLALGSHDNYPNQHSALKILLQVIGHEGYCQVDLVPPRFTQM